MSTTNCKKFKGEIENYLNNGLHNFESKIDSAVSALKFKTWLCKANIIKKDGYHACQLLFILVILPLLKVKTVHSFCQKHWLQWSSARKETLYRFKQNVNYRWRTFLYKNNCQIFEAIELSKQTQQDIYFVIDDTFLAKLGRKVENVSFIHDHNMGRSVLGYCIVTLGLFTAQGFYPQLKKDKWTNLLLKRVSVKLPQSDEMAVIIFSRGYCEPEIDKPKGSKKKKEPKWVAFLSTDIQLHASTIIKKYTKRWPIKIDLYDYIYKIDYCLMISLVTFFCGSCSCIASRQPHTHMTHKY